MPAKPARTLDSTPTDAWVAELREGPVSQLAEAGEKAAPIIAATLDDPEATEGAKFALQWAKGDRQWMVPILADRVSHPDRTERRWALASLGDFGPDAARAVPA